MEERPAFRGTGCKPGCLGWICSVNHYGAGGKVYHKASEIKKGGCGCK